jgi:hypothetical protein
MKSLSILVSRAPALTLTLSLTIVSLTVVSLSVRAQQVKTPRDSKMASVSEQIGITDVRIDYSRPGVKGREGNIWGNEVQYGFVDFHYGTSKAAPWRAGANENTTFECSTDVTIEGQPLPAGKYGFFVAMGPDRATLVFSRDNNAWGSFYYDSTNDILRVQVPVIKANENVEWLKYEFGNETDSSAIISLQWEKMKIPFTIGVNLKKTRLAAYQYAFNSGSFYEYWQNMQQAADFCLENDIDLEEGLRWADRSINTYFGEANFSTLSTYSGLLEKAGRKHEADSLLKLAFAKGTTRDIYFYGQKLIRMKEFKQAIEVYKLNYEKDPKDMAANFGMAKASAMTGNKAEALKFVDKSIQLAGDQSTKNYFDKVKQAIIDGKDVSGF